MARLNAAGIMVHRTDEDGALRITFEADGTVVESWGNGRDGQGYERSVRRE
jgi:beta-lactamase superfamily II metal-dependent hydrolase